MPGPMKSICFLCGEPFEFGSHPYDGRHVRKWQVDVCNVCLHASRDGLVPGSNPKLLEHLQQLKIPIRLNDKGWVDWPPDEPRSG
jgi:hypothetical protein